jgi:hypothetical protein
VRPAAVLGPLVCGGPPVNRVRCFRLAHRFEVASVRCRGQGGAPVQERPCRGEDRLVLLAAAGAGVRAQVGPAALLGPVAAGLDAMGCGARASFVGLDAPSSDRSPTWMGGRGQRGGRSIGAPPVPGRPVRLLAVAGRRDAGSGPVGRVAGWAAGPSGDLARRVDEEWAMWCPPLPAPPGGRPPAVVAWTPQSSPRWRLFLRGPHPGDHRARRQLHQSECGSRTDPPARVRGDQLMGTRPRTVARRRASSPRPLVRVLPQ